MSSMYPSFGGAARPCMRCGAPLAINQGQCSRCGAYNPLPQGQQFGTFQQGQQGTSSDLSWGGQPSQESQFPQAGGGAWPGTAESSSAWGSTGQAGSRPQNTLFPPQNRLISPSQQNPFADNGTGSPGQSQPLFHNSFNNFQQNPNQTSQNNFFPASQPNNFGSSRLSTLERQRGGMQGQRSGRDDNDNGKKRTNPAVVAVIVVLLLAVVGGGGFAAYSYLKHHNAPSTASNGTTPVVIATPSGTSLFSDKFQNNNAGWDLTQPTGAKITLAGGKMVLESDNHQLFPEMVPSKTFDDFRLDVDTGLTSGDTANGYGVYIRAAASQNSPLGLYYRFEFYGDGSFYVYKGSIDANGKAQQDPLDHSDPNKPIKAINAEGQINHLTIVAKGSQLTFTVNGVIVSSFKDNTYKSGSIALFVSNTAHAAPGGAQATFQNLTIFPAP